LNAGKKHTHRHQGVHDIHGHEQSGAYLTHVDLFLDKNETKVNKYYAKDKCNDLCEQAEIFFQPFGNRQFDQGGNPDMDPLAHPRADSEISREKIQIANDLIAPAKGIINDIPGEYVKYHDKYHSQSEIACYKIFQFYVNKEIKDFLHSKSSISRIRQNTGLTQYSDDRQD
jgi:hypothetical protein